MIEILEMPDTQMSDLLKRIGFGHFACSRGEQPYVVPIHYAYDEPYIYIYTTEGAKSEIIKDNPKVCLQVEEILDDGTWKSVVVMGTARQILDPEEREKAVNLIRSSNPTLLPALAIKWANNWIRENIEVIYRIEPKEVTGRYSLQIEQIAAAAQPGKARKP
jgi:nitroimidazol reductase NimA-like FMN-containing flavoprotein (pyridoxamine 5'-phosphate oxidase superfamily)